MTSETFTEEKAPRSEADLVEAALALALAAVVAVAVAVAELRSGFIGFPAAGIRPLEGAWGLGIPFGSRRRCTGQESSSTLN